MNVEVLSVEKYYQYNRFVENTKETMFFGSLKFKSLLEETIKGTAQYLLCIENNEVVGVLPTFIVESGDKRVINSLPFYGSHGAVITKECRRDVKLKLLESFKLLAKKNKCISSTLVTSPFEKDLDLYEDFFSTSIKDYRIGQLTLLESQSTLMDSFHYKTRNSIRKGYKLGVEIKAESNSSAMNFLVDTHKKNMKSINGISKPEVFFQAILNELKVDEDYRIFTAYLDGQPIAAVLVLYFNKTVEYFTPVILKEYRNTQALSVVIYEAMLKAIDEGYKWWNWGGTWKSQDGVYKFKSKWGTMDINYYYFTDIYDKSIYSMTSVELLNKFPYYFTIPFERLNSNE